MLGDYLAPAREGLDDVALARLDKAEDGRRLEQRVRPPVAGIAAAGRTGGTAAGAGAGARGLGRLQVVDNVTLGHPAAQAGAANLAQIEAVLTGHLEHQRRVTRGRPTLLTRRPLR